MVGQHNAAGADADGVGRGGNVPDDDAGRGAGDAAHAVMFGDPVTGEAQPFGVDCKIGGVGECGGDIAALNNRDEIEQRICGHRA
jgi:hypothetical protein